MVWERVPVCGIKNNESAQNNFDRSRKTRSVVSDIHLCLRLMSLERFLEDFGIVICEASWQTV
jgi:hypothetical protein